MDQYEKAYIVDPMTGEPCDGFYITRDQKAIKVSGGKVYVNGIASHSVHPGTSGIRVDEQKYNRTILRRLSGQEHSDAMNAEPPRF